MTISFEEIKNLKILVIGDVMLDQFVYGSVNRISPEAPVPVLKISHTTEMLGGAGNVVNNLLSLGANVTFLGLIGDDGNGKQIQSLLQVKEKLESYLYVDDEYRTVTKTRFVGGIQHMVRVDQELDFTMSADLEKQIIAKLYELMLLVDVIIISDYNKGFITSNIKVALGKIKTPAKKVLDAKGSLKEYAGQIDYITPNIKEAEQYSGINITSPETMSFAASAICRKYNLNKILITASEKGMYLFEAITEHPVTGVPLWSIQHQKTLNTTPVDISGAGDTVISALAIAIGLKVDHAIAMEFASQCAAISISKSGTSIVTLDEIMAKYQPSPTIDFRNIENVVETIDKIRSVKTIGFVNGVFDLLHGGHIALLENARRHCDFLIVGINSDTSVKQIKGDSRPIIKEHDRATMLSAIRYVDAVIIFDEVTPEEILKQIRPDVVVKSSQYKDGNLPELTTLTEISCNLIYVDPDPSQSTTTIINDIKK